MNIAARKIFKTAKESRFGKYLSTLAVQTYCRIKKHGHLYEVVCSYRYNGMINKTRYCRARTLLCIYVPLRLKSECHTDPS